MKLRRLPEDFRVRELTAVRPTGGPFAFYRLTKTSIGTPEALQAICERWNLPRQRLSYGGLKDRHAITTQHLTIHHGPRRTLRQSSFTLEYLGQTAHPFTSREMDGNAFQLVLRDMSGDEVRKAMSAAQSIETTGLPNYFDDQRFGSLGQSGEWIARAWCFGNWERALWLALADPHPFDPADEKRQKQILREFWGRWPECQRALDRSHRRSIATFLADKVSAGRAPDYRGALARIRADLRGLYLSAYQSALWNRLLTACLKHVLPASAWQPFELISGPAVFPLTVIEDPQDIPFEALPLPSARIDEPQGTTGRLLAEILAAEQIELRQLRVKYPRDSFFSRGTRAALVKPADFRAVAADDDLYAGRQRLTLEFSLPRGSYATIMVKRLTGTAVEPGAEDF